MNCTPKVLCSTFGVQFITTQPLRIILFYSEAFLNCLLKGLPLFFEPLEYSLASEMETVVVVIGQVTLDLYLDISYIHIFIHIGVIERCAGFE